jgi:hypothetical protein
VATNRSAIFNRSVIKALLVYGAALFAIFALESLAKAQDLVLPVIDPATIEPALPEQASVMSFSRACESGDHLMIAAVGDVLPHEGLAQQAYTSKLGFGSLWPKLTPYIQSADMAYANLEGPAAEGVAANGVLKSDPGEMLDHDVYTGTDLMFNYNPRIINDLKTTGFDIVSVANNHALDRTSIGVDRTIEAMNSRGLQFSGGHESSNAQAPIETIVERAGFRVAWIACIDVYNGPDPKHLITGCGDEAKMISTIQRLNQDTSIDAVIVAPHWGVEYHHIASARQRLLARKFLEAGASAIIGSHPHMLEEVETYRTRDGRDTVIAYSLGNFVSGQGKRPGLKTSMMLFVGLTKRAGEKAWVNGASYLPLWMDRGPHSINIAEKSNQAPHATVERIVTHLADPARELKAGSPIRTDLGCQ